MSKITITLDELNRGDILEENIFRHDTLLALPIGTRIDKKEAEYLKDLKVEEVQVSRGVNNRQYSEEEMLEIIQDVYLANTLWGAKTGSKIFNGIKKRFKKNKKVTEVLSILRMVDHYAFSASVNISIITGKMVMINNSVDNDLISIIYYSLIHDIGRVKVSEITNRKGKLSETEMQEVRNHPVYSYKFLEKFKLPKKEINFVMQTHEKYDGTGYPVGFEKNEIEPLAQLIAIAEMYNALSSFRPHRPAYHPIEVRNIIEMERNRSFGEKYIDIFMKRFIPYREDSYVEMSDGRMGKIIEINEKMPMFPVVEIYKKGKEEQRQVEITINLFKQRELRIARVFV